MRLSSGCRQNPLPMVVNANDNLWVTGIWLLLMRLAVACGYVDEGSIYFSVFPPKKKPQFDYQRWNLVLLAAEMSSCLSELGGRKSIRRQGVILG